MYITIVDENLMKNEKYEKGTIRGKIVENL
jgi:hypothetical protein